MPDEISQSEATAQLAAQIGELAEVLRDLQATTRRTDRRGRWTLAGVVVFAALILAGIGQAALDVRQRDDRAAQSTAILEAIRASQDTVKDCTSPGHACYDENQARSNQRLAPIVSVICAMAEADGVAPERRRPLCPT